MKKILFAMLAVMSLGACGGDPVREYYADHAFGKLQGDYTNLVIAVRSHKDAVLDGQTPDERDSVEDEVSNQLIYVYNDLDMSLVSDKKLKEIGAEQIKKNLVELRLTTDALHHYGEKLVDCSMESMTKTGVPKACGDYFRAVQKIMDDKSIVDVKLI